MRRLLLSLMLLCCGAVLAQAGPNAGGTLVWHVDPAVVYTTDTPDYCGASGIACEREFGGSSCDNGYDFEADCQARFADLNPTGPADGGTYIATVLAAFPEGSCPRLSGITFGFGDYTEGNVSFVAQAGCGDFELPTQNWPGEFEGTAVTFSAPVIAQLIEVYWFATYAYYGDQPSLLPLAPHPTQDGSFADDSVPSILDDIAGYSTLGLNGSVGQNVLPAAGPADGACCFPDGSCLVVSEGGCVGVYQGDGTVCDPNPCPQPPAEGACCFADGSCVVLTESACVAAPGSYQGDNTGCDPNPCPQPEPEGACCRDDGDCFVSTEANCLETSGTYQGDDTVCDPNPCPQPPATGACCFEDGSCVVTIEAECNGDYQGDDTVCDPNPCPQPPPTGACCFPDGGCLVLTEDDCVGTERQPSTPRTHPDLMGRAGVPGEYQGDGTVCDPNPCPQPPAKGACCLPDGSCFVGAADGCNEAGGTYQGDDTVCDPNPCPQPPAEGACCFENGVCNVAPEDACGDAGGVYQGDDTVCDPNPCPQPPGEGACCFDDGSCQVLTADACNTAEGTYQGTDTVCDPNPCPQPPAEGACCFADGSCTVTTEAGCDGAYQGDDTVCDPNPCPQPPAEGACCFDDGSCTVTTEAGCNGAYQGDDTVCDPNPCVADLGALDISATILGDDAVVDVEVDGPSGTFTGQTPLVIDDLMPGSYEVKWVKPGHGGCVEEYVVEFGETTFATCALTPYFISVLQFVTEATPNRLDIADLGREVTVRVKGFTGNVDARSIDLNWIYLGSDRVVGANPRVVGYSPTNKGVVEFTVSTQTILDALGTGAVIGGQQSAKLDVWTRLTNGQWVRSSLNVVLYRSSASLSNLAAEGAFGATVRPNPAPGETWIEWNNPTSGQTDLAIYDASGRVLRQLVSETRSAGIHQVQWDGRDASGSAMPSGVYYYRLTLRETGEQVSDKIYLVR